MLNCGTICFETWDQNKPQDSSWKTQLKMAATIANTSHKATLDLKDIGLKYGTALGVTWWHKNLKFWEDDIEPQAKQDIACLAN